MGKVCVLSGVSGAGKSTYIKGVLIPENAGANNITIVSANNFFIDANGSYYFEPSKLQLAHADCFRKFIVACQNEHDVVIVDNVNAGIDEASPYMLAGEAFGYESELITILCRDSHELVKMKRRSPHRVGWETMKRQHHRICDRVLPKRWNCSSVNAQFGADEG